MELEFILHLHNCKFIFLGRKVIVQNSYEGNKKE